MDFSVAIPTYKREELLEETLNSILEQKNLPKEVIIVDDANLTDEFVAQNQKAFEKAGILFIYYRKNHQKEQKSLSESKNIALKLARTEIVFVIDDDVVLLPNSLNRIIQVWENHSTDTTLLGVGTVAVNGRKKTKFENIYNKFFGLNSKNLWDVNEVGFQVWDNSIEKQTTGFYMSGYTTSFKKRHALKLLFAPLSPGRTALEDVDMCLRAKKRGYYFIIEPSAKVIHKQSRISRDGAFEIGSKEGYNRKLIFQNNCQKGGRHLIWFWWASIGWILRQFLVGHFFKAFGMIKGYCTPLK